MNSKSLLGLLHRLISIVLHFESPPKFTSRRDRYTVDGRPGVPEIAK